MRIFIPLVGQFTNIGDTLHRKILISWFNNQNIQLHLYVGKAPESFIYGLNLPKNAILYRNIFNWIYKIIFSSIFKKTRFIFNPGELTFRNKRFLGEILLLPMFTFIKLFDVKIYRVGVAAKLNIRIKFLTIWKFIFSFSNAIYWRTEVSRLLINKGITIPDLAFYDVDVNINYEDKNNLVLSMRGDKSMPNQLWFDSINEFSKTNKLSIIVISQVRMDNVSTQYISDKLNCDAVLWADNVNHKEQEDILNSIYRKSVMAISDRLHVLIAAFTKGVIPVNLASSYSDKVDAHFDVIGVNNVTIDTNSNSKETIINFLETKLLNRFEEAKMVDAKKRLEIIRQTISKI